MSHSNSSFDARTATLWARLRRGRVSLAVILLLATLALSACLSRFSTTNPIRTPVVLPAPGGGQPQIVISPPSGYAGVYVQVVGNGWPANDLVLVVLSDDAGRSGILAASAASSRTAIRGPRPWRSLVQSVDGAASNEKLESDIGSPAQ